MFNTEQLGGIGIHFALSKNIDMTNVCLFKMALESTREDSKTSVNRTIFCQHYPCQIQSVNETHNLIAATVAWNEDWEICIPICIAETVDEIWESKHARAQLFAAIIKWTFPVLGIVDHNQGRLFHLAG